MNLEIVLWPHPVLLEGTQPLHGIDDELKKIVAEMKSVMFRLRGVGLAAPQVGIAKRFMLVCPTGQPGDEEAVFNPVVLEADGREVGEEGCLSFPGLYGDVPRATNIKVRYRDIQWREREMELEGFVARVFLHELDHLDGRVFIDRMVASSREKLEPGLEALRLRYAAETA